MPWLLVGLGSHLILGYPIDILVDVFHGILRLLLLSNSPSDMVVPQSYDELDCLIPSQISGITWKCG